MSDHISWLAMTRRSYTENNEAEQLDGWQSGLLLIDVSLHGRFDPAVAFCRQNKTERIR